MKPLCNANIEVLNQLKELVQLSTDIYVKKPNSKHAGIGEHVRHVLDHYRALRNGLPTRKVDYNLRTRNSLEESQPHVAQKKIDELINWLANLDYDDSDITVVSEISLRENQSQTLQSNTEREMLYLINHSIHHMAYASLLASVNGINLPAYIGLAPGTATYQREQKQQQETH